MRRLVKTLHLPLILSLPFLFPLPSSLAQKTPQPNLIPNPGFELFSDQPYGWYYSGRDFSRVALYWTSPNASSPDLYAPGATVPKSWKAAGFGTTFPFEGKSCAGITVYGCKSGKPHCREYVQIQLSEPLVPGQRYGFSAMIAHLPRSVIVRNIELAFSEFEIDEPMHDPILLSPTLTINRFLPSDGKWYRWTGHFEASTDASYLLIGNFHTDDDSQIKLPWKSDIRFGYYYLDDIELFKIPPVIKAPVTESPLTNFIPGKGGSVSLSKIYFEHDRTDFLPQAQIQLRQLLDFLKRYPDIHVEIRGHTDSVGTSAYNQDLSERRSKAVVHWLIQKGIHPERLTSSGAGSNEPVSLNTTSKGRSQNRRVEVKITRL